VVFDMFDTGDEGEQVQVTRGGKIEHNLRRSRDPVRLHVPKGIKASKYYCKIGWVVGANMSQVKSMPSSAGGSRGQNPEACCASDCILLKGNNTKRRRSNKLLCIGSKIFN
jgi:hypothetical protein